MEVSKDAQVRTFPVGNTRYGVAILPIPSTNPSLSFSITAAENVVKSRNKDRTKEKEYVERRLVLKTDTKSYSALVHPLPKPGYKRESDKYMGILKIGQDGKVSFNFCFQKQDFKQDIEYVEIKKDIYREQEELQMRRLDARRKNENVFGSYNFDSEPEDKEDKEKDKEKEKKVKKKKISSDDEDEVDFRADNDSD